MIGQVPNAILLGRWFGPRLPTAMAILYSATGAGILVLLPLSQVLIDRIGWRDAYQWFGAVALCLMVPLLLLPWRLFASGSPHVTRKADPAFVDDAGWTLHERDPSPRLLGAVLDLLLHGGRDVRDHGADRRLSDRCRLPAAAGGDRLGLFRHRAAVRHARHLHPRRPDRPPAVGAVQLRRLDRRDHSALADPVLSRTTGC